VIFMQYLETIVCQAKEGKEARFERMVKSRIELAKRQGGCVNSWFGKSSTDEFLFLIQTVYQDLDSFHEVKKLVDSTLDPKDGGLESCLSGPPLLGLFKIDDNTTNTPK